MSLDEARAVATRALMARRPDVALVLINGVLLGEPEDPVALTLRARALRDLGRLDEATEAGALAWQAAETPTERFYAAMVRAQTGATAGRKGMAQLWLRRASAIAPDEEARAVAIRDFRVVRRQTPWRLSLDLSVAPSDNLNDAPRTNEFTFGGLTFINPTAVPLSGIRYGVDADYLYRFALDGNARLNLRAGGGLSRVRFSEEARDEVPGLDNEDFRQEHMNVGIGLERRGEEGRWLGSVDLLFRRDWVGGDVLSDTRQVSLSYGRSFGSHLILTGHGAITDNHRHDAGVRDATTRSGGVLTQWKGTQGTVSLDLSRADISSDSRSLARQVDRVQLGYSHATPIKGTQPRVALSWQSEDFDFGPSTFWLDPREDDVWRLSVDVLLPKLERYGFAPEIGVSFEDRRSNYSLYESRSTDLRFGLKSVF
ncbi:DUF560 domain-containing protein [Sagittula sp. NFXS13]|uniref:tetratricopeptide repeat protein n=1 Tax=Sagittula sp. NFXS13 TaxID=2819095 RepID=UPI0032DE7F16